MPVTVETLLQEPYRQVINANGHTFFADVPPDKGGQNTAPDPHQLLLGAWGSCTAMTIQMYARRKGWPLEGIHVTLNVKRQPGKIPVIQKDIQISGSQLTQVQMQALERIAEKCPVNQLITGEKQVLRTFSLLKTV